MKHKYKKKEMNLNPYTIYWAIYINHYGEIASMQHYPSKQEAIAKHPVIINTNVFFITDKQFGLIDNTIKFEQWKPTKVLNGLYVKDKFGSCVTIPITTKQLNNRIQY